MIYVLTSGDPADFTEVVSTFTCKILFSTTEFGFSSSLAGSMFITLMAVSHVFLYALHNRLEVD